MLLTVDGLSKAFGGVAAVDGASFDVAEGSITALIGPNGAGKTTVFNLVSGFMRPDGGLIHFGGRRIDSLSGDAVARAGLIRVFQTPRVLTRMTVLENMLLAAKHQPGERLHLAWSWSRRVAGRERDIHTQAREILALVRLIDLADAFAGVAEDDDATAIHHVPGHEVGVAGTAQRAGLHDLPGARAHVAVDHDLGAANGHTGNGAGVAADHDRAAIHVVGQPPAGVVVDLETRPVGQSGAKIAGRAAHPHCDIVGQPDTEVVAGVGIYELDVFGIGAARADPLIGVADVDLR